MDTQDNVRGYSAYVQFLCEFELCRRPLAVIYVRAFANAQPRRFAQLVKKVSKKTRTSQSEILRRWRIRR